MTCTCETCASFHAALAKALGNLLDRTPTYGTKETK